MGSACFAVAAVPSLASAVGTRTDNLVYFVGSLFFTTAGFLLYAQVVGVDAPVDRDGGARARRLLSFQPHRIDWLAAVIQSLGTLFFNVSTGHALVVTYTNPVASDQGLWRPDAFGSVCFLVSSYLSYAEVCHGTARWQPKDLSWWITVGNLVGSVAFGVSAVASKVLSSGELRSVVVDHDRDLRRRPVLPRRVDPAAPRTDRGPGHGTGPLPPLTAVGGDPRSDGWRQPTGGVSRRAGTRLPGRRPRSNRPPCRAGTGGRRPTGTKAR